MSSNWIGAITCLKIVLTTITHTLLRIDLSKIIAESLVSMIAVASTHETAPVILQKWWEILVK